MANRRMFSLGVVDTDRFLDMPASAQSLYFHLGMRADDDGFVSSQRKIIKAIGAANDDMRLLTAKGYVIPFESGVCVITDWKQNNLIKSDRYKETIYKPEKSLLSSDANGSYMLVGTLPEPEWNQSGTKAEPQVRLGKDSKVEDIILSENHGGKPPEMKIDYTVIVALFNELCPSLPVVKKLNNGVWMALDYFAGRQRDGAALL